MWQPLCFILNVCFNGDKFVVFPFCEKFEAFGEEVERYELIGWFFFHDIIKQEVPDRQNLNTVKPQLSSWWVFGNPKYLTKIRPTKKYIKSLEKINLKNYRKLLEICSHQTLTNAKDPTNSGSWRCYPKFYRNILFNFS